MRISLMFENKKETEKSYSEIAKPYKSEKE